MTLLDLVQNIMSSLSLEEVNSIEDTPESVQIATTAQETFYAILADREWEFLNKTFSLDASGDNLKPILMTLPSNITDLRALQYLDEDDGKYTDIAYLAPEIFLEKLNQRELGGTITEFSNILNQANVSLKVFNERQPKYFTSFDENVLVFDAYNTTYDVTLQSSKTLCYGTELPTFEITDEYVIPIPDEMIWSYFLPETKSTCNLNLLQTVNQKEEQKSRRGRWRMYHAHPKTTNDYRRSAARFGRK